MLFRLIFTCMATLLVAVLIGNLDVLTYDRERSAIAQSVLDATHPDSTFWDQKSIQFVAPPADIQKRPASTLLPQPGSAQPITHRPKYGDSYINVVTPSALTGLLYCEESRVIVYTAERERGEPLPFNHGRIELATEQVGDGPQKLIGRVHSVSGNDPVTHEALIELGAVLSEAPASCKLHHLLVEKVKSDVFPFYAGVTDAVFQVGDSRILVDFQADGRIQQVKSRNVTQTHHTHDLEAIATAFAQELLKHQQDHPAPAP